MTRAEQIDAAVQLLNPSPDKRAECQHDVELMIDWVNSESKAKNAFKAFQSKQGKASLRRYEKALKQLQAAYNALHPSIRPWFSLAETAYVAGKPTIIGRELAKAAQILAQPAASPKPDAITAKAGATAAYSLLPWWGHKASLTRSGKWELLAKVLSDGATVFEHMRAFKRDPKLVFAKCKCKTGYVIIHSAV